MRIYFRWAALLAAVGAAGACAPARPAAGARQPDFRGVYLVGPDRSAFRPCGSDEEWYVEVQGDTVALTAGPVGQYARELRLTRVLVARPAPRAECP